MQQPIPVFVKAARKKAGLTQKDLAEKAGVGLHFIRDVEQGKPNLQVAKVNSVLALFGYQLGPVLITTLNPSSKREGDAKVRDGG